jgi:hypothetical protein
VSPIASVTVPVVLPLVDVRISADGTATVTVDRVPYDSAAALGRDGVDRVVNEIAAHRGPVRVRVTESDQSVFTDVVLPASAPAAPEPPAQPDSGFAGEGFLPDEPVDVAVIVAHRAADADGHAVLRLPPALLARHGGTIVLLGRTSGTVTICESP